MITKLFSNRALLGACMMCVAGGLSLHADWTEVAIPGESQRPQDLIYYSGLFVAVGYSGEIITSTDGVEWSLASIELEPVDDFLPSFRAVTASDGMLMAVGDLGVVATSTNGTEWTVNQQGESGVSGYSDVAYGNGLFVVTNYSDSVLYSTDGSTWETKKVNIFSITFTKVLFFNGEFVLFQSSYGNDVAVSTDAISWSWESAGIDGYYTNSAKVVGDQMLLGSYDLNGRTIFASEGSTAFSQSSLNVEVLGYIQGFAGGQDVIAAVGGNYFDPSFGYVLVSSDGGANFSIDTDELSHVANAIVYGNDTWVIVGEGYAAYTTDLSGGNVPTTPYLVEGAEDYGDGWYASWMGDINVNQWPWVYASIGWFYAGNAGNSNDSGWYFMTATELNCWLYTGETTFPWVYGQPSGQAAGWWYVDTEKDDYTYFFSGSGAVVAVPDEF